MTRTDFSRSISTVACSVYAAGDVTNHPFKHASLACAQADAAAETIAAHAGVSINPAPYRRVLDDVLLTERAALFMRRDLDADGDVGAVAAAAASAGERRRPPGASSPSTSGSRRDLRSHPSATRPAPATPTRLPNASTPSPAVGRGARRTRHICPPGGPRATAGAAGRSRRTPSRGRAHDRAVPSRRSRRSAAASICGLRPTRSRRDLRQTRRRARPGHCPPAARRTPRARRGRIHAHRHRPARPAVHRLRRRTTAGRTERRCATPPLAPVAHPGPSVRAPSARAHRHSRHPAAHRLRPSQVA
jgi:hypothetical protein